MYHHWTYGLDGAIEHIPDLSSFPQGCPPGGRIQSLPAGEWGSFVWFSLNPEVEPLLDYLDPVHAHLVTGPEPQGVRPSNTQPDLPAARRKRRKESPRPRR